MRKFILIAGFVLASATAQAGEARSLSLSGSDTLAPPATTKTADSSQTAQAPQSTEAPKAEAPKEAPKYVERPVAVDDVRPAATKAIADVFDLAFEVVPGEDAGLWAQPIHASLAAH